MVTNIQVMTYRLNSYSIKHYLGQLLAEFGAAIANIKYLSALQTFGHSQN